MYVLITLSTLLASTPANVGAFAPPQAVTDTVVLGSMGSRFRVNQNGQATYRVPVHVPPGTRRFEPTLELVYNHGSEGGVLGVGWQLAGTDVEHVGRAADG